MSRFAIGIALLVLVWVPLAKAADRFELLEQCARGVSHAEQRLCLEERAKRSDRTLATVQRALVAALNKADQDPADRQVALDAAQADHRAFSAYRTHHCEAFATLAFGGNSMEDRRAACLIELNDQRSLQLRTIIESLTGPVDTHPKN